MGRHARTASLARKSAELGLAAPQVVALRLSRMWLAGPHPGARDRAENSRMVNEKVMAFSQSWLAMWTAWWLMPLRLAPALAGGGGGHRALAHAGSCLLLDGLKPVHRVAVANAKRLSRRRA